MTRLIAVFGASPGIGKSTLSETLAVSAERSGRVDLFHEEEILSRPEFAAAAAQFRESGAVDLDVLLDASERFVESALNFDIVVTDALFPFVPSLLAWGHDEETIQSFVATLRTILEPLCPVTLYLDGDPAQALLRTVSRSGDEWLTRFVTKTASYKVTPPIRDLNDTIAFLRRERDVTLRSMKTAGFEIVTLSDAHARSTDELADEALTRLGLTNETS
jgi:hypothetical protein